MHGIISLRDINQVVESITWYLHMHRSGIPWLRQSTGLHIITRRQNDQCCQPKTDVLSMKACDGNVWPGYGRILTESNTPQNCTLGHACALTIHQNPSGQMLAPPSWTSTPTCTCITAVMHLHVRVMHLHVSRGIPRVLHGCEAVLLCIHGAPRPPV